MESAANAEEPHPDDDEDAFAALVEFGAALELVQNRRRAAPLAPDYQRLVDAYRAAHPVPPRLACAVPREPARSRDECPRCGIPGFKGCEHQLPYDREAAGYTPAPRRASHYERKARA